MTKRLAVLIVLCLVTFRYTDRCQTDRHKAIAYTVPSCA